jgi:hypothetical protein
VSNSQLISPTQEDFRGHGADLDKVAKAAKVPTAAAKNSKEMKGVAQASPPAVESDEKIIMLSRFQRLRFMY